MIVNIIQDLGKRMEAKIEKMQIVYTKDLQWTCFEWTPGVGVLWFMGSRSQIRLSD